MTKQYNKISGTSIEINIMFAPTVFSEDVKPYTNCTLCVARNRVDVYGRSSKENVLRVKGNRIPLP